MPVVGFGTSRTEDPESQVEMALSAGHRHFDCALVSSFYCGLRDLTTCCGNFVVISLMLDVHIFVIIFITIFK